MVRPNTIPLPTTQDSSDKTLGILQPGHFPNIVEAESMANIVNRIAIIELRVELICAKRFTRRAPIGGGCSAVPSRAPVQRMTPGIVGIEGDTVTCLFLQLHLEPVVI